METIYHLLSDIPQGQDHESVFELLKDRSVRIERIISRGQGSPPGFWYDQEEDEWVVVLSGQARVSIEGRQESVALAPGDALYLPARLRHRVEWTDPLRPTVWLAVFWKF